MKAALLWGALVLSGCGGAGGAAGEAPAPAPTVQEQQCLAAGWQRGVVQAEGLPRLVLWKAPAGAWTRGAIVVMHGGGGSHTNFCAANVALIEPQVRFTEAALAQGFAVFLLDSSDQVSDDAGRVCGKVWDDEPRARPNLDLPFVEAVLVREIAARRPVGSHAGVFLVGHSSGGFMAVRTATRHGALVRAFAAVAAGDPYGWTRDCTRRAGDRANVAGIGLDLETRLQITFPGACEAASYPRERAWDGLPADPRPAFRVFHHAEDGILDRSCVHKLRRQLAARGYPETTPFELTGGARSVDAHYWLDAYNAPLLAWFAAFAP
ncbi:MAG: alpha/beta fold hydrolase [Rubrivivax sp.]|nr:alpha/beta fold hydrolase [Rubrivivax sp.]